MKNFNHEYNDRMEDMLDQFMNKIVERKMGEIERCVRKTENRLKKLQHVIKDKHEETRSIRNISEHRIKRSHSRSKRDASPRTTPNTSLPRNPVRKNMLSQQPASVESFSASKSKVSDNSKASSMQFEVIATKYEEMIKNKTT